MTVPTPLVSPPERRDLTTRRLIVFALLAAVLATFLTDYRYAEVGLEEIDPIVRRAMDPDHLTNDFFTNVTDEFGPRFYSTRLIAALATPGSLPVFYFALTLVINIAIAVLTGLFARELFKSNAAGLFAVALVMGAISFKLGGAGQAHADEPNSYWMSFPFAIAAVWAACRTRPIVAGLMAGLASLLHPAFGASVGGLIFTALMVALWDRRRREGTTIPFLGVGAGVVLFAALLGAFVIPYAGGSRIPDEQLFDIMRFRLPHHILPSTFDLSDWVQGLGFMVALILAWRWLRPKNLPDRFETTVLATMFAGLLLFFLGGYLFVEVWPWKPLLILIPFRSTSYFVWLGLLVIGGNAARRMTDSAQVGEGVMLQVSSFNPISSALAHLAVFARENRRIARPLFVGAVVAALVVGLASSEPRNVVLFALVNGLAVWFFCGPDRVWASVVGIGVPLALTSGLVAYQSVFHTEGALDRVGPEIVRSQVEGPESDIADAARDLTPADSVILTPPSFGTFRVLSERAIVVDTRDIPYQEDAMAEWMDRILTIYGTPGAEGLESQDFGVDEPESFDDSYRAITDQDVRGLCERYSITYAVLFSETATSFPVLDKNDTYQLVELSDCQ